MRYPNAGRDSCVRFGHAAAILFAVAMLGTPAGATEVGPIPPDHAALACHAHAEHELAADGARNPEAVEWYDFEETGESQVHVTGVFSAVVDGEERRFDIACDVTEAGVEGFTVNGEDRSESGEGAKSQSN